MKQRYEKKPPKNIKNLLVAPLKDEQIQEMPAATGWILALIFAVSAVDDSRSLLYRASERGMQPKYAWGLVAALSYSACAVLLIKRPRWAMLAFTSLLISSLFSEPRESIVVLTYGLILASSYIFNWRWFLPCQLFWISWITLYAWDQGALSVMRAVIWMVAITVLGRSLRGIAMRTKTEKHRSLMTLKEAQRENEILAHREALAKNRRREERERLSRDLHDYAAHSLTRIAMQASLARRKTDDREAKNSFQDIAQSARAGLLEIRTLVELIGNEGSLSDSMSRGKITKDISTQIQDTVNYLASLGNKVSTTIVGSPFEGLPEEILECVAQILREGSTNIIKHGSEGALCSIEISLDEKSLSVRIENSQTAPTLHLPSSGRGLDGLKKRAALLGGKFEAGAVDGWWRLAVVLPIERAKIH